MTTKLFLGLFFSPPVDWKASVISSGQSLFTWTSQKLNSKPNQIYLDPQITVFSLEGFTVCTVVTPSVRKDQKQNLWGKKKKSEAEPRMRDPQSLCMCREPLYDCSSVTEGILVFTISIFKKEGLKSTLNSDPMIQTGSCFQKKHVLIAEGSASSITFGNPRNYFLATRDFWLKSKFLRICFRPAFPRLLLLGN